MNYKILNIIDVEYPEKLKRIKKPPEKLYYVGDLNLLKEPIFAIIGTRYATEYGRKIGNYFAQELAKKFVIISGMAIGIDTVSHKGALKVSGKTIAVLGSGFDKIFPEENKNLFGEIIEKGGLVLSEYDPKTEAKSANFPKRNRIVSGLSDGILVIEAGYRSGTGITVGLAKEQGKKVFAIPGRLDSEYGIGVNRFIKEGAELVTQIDDILNFYPQIKNKKWKNISQNQEIKEEYKEIFELLKQEQMGVEEIATRLKENNIRKIMTTLSLMEIEGLIDNEIGKGYRIILIPPGADAKEKNIF